jgi:hypothetical protein
MDGPWKIIDQGAPDMGPLRRSHEADDVESELKALFLSLHEQYLKGIERDMQTLGVPHLGGQSQFERAVKAEGLALLGTGDSQALRYVFKAWKARNPRRGLHMLKLYLQLLWPNSWECNQLWQNKSAPYPTDLSKADGGNHYLTSRVDVRISAGASTGGDVATVAPALRSVLPARIVLTLAIEQAVESEIQVAGAMYAGMVFQQFDGTIDRIDDPLEMGAGAYQGAVIQVFSGTIQ